MSVVPGDRRGTVDHERVCTLLPWPFCGTGHGGTHLLQQEQPQLWQSMWISQVQCTHEVLQGPRRCQWTLGSTGMIPPVHVQRLELVLWRYTWFVFCSVHQPVEEAVCIRNMVWERAHKRKEAPVEAEWQYPAVPLSMEEFQLTPSYPGWDQQHIPIQALIAHIATDDVCKII